MMERDILIGGEESGGIGYSRFLPERDGILNSLLLANVMAEEQKPLGVLVAELQKEYGPHYYGRRDLHISDEAKNRAIDRAQSEQTKRLGKYAVLNKAGDGWNQVFSRRAHQRQWRGSLGSVPGLGNRAAVAHLHRSRFAGAGGRNSGVGGSVCSFCVILRRRSGNAEGPLGGHYSCAPTFSTIVSGVMLAGFT